METSQELQYLREEMNQRIQFFYDNAGKTIRIVLLIWGAMLTIWGFEKFDIESPFISFLYGSLFFMSNLTIYYSAEKDNHNHYDPIGLFFPPSTHE